LQKTSQYENMCDYFLFDTAKVYLYGSYSKGNARPESDIDVAVIVPKLNNDWLKLSTRLWVIAPKVDLHIEPVFLEVSIERNEK